MALKIPRRAIPLARLVESRLCRNYCSRASVFLDKGMGKLEPDSTCGGQGKVSRSSMGTHMALSALFFPGCKPPVGGYSIEVVDAETWQVSAGLAHAWRPNPEHLGCREVAASADEPVRGDDSLSAEGGNHDPDYDEIDNMRIRGNLYYKLDRASKEFEEYNFDFHRKKSPKRKEDLVEVTEKDNPRQNSSSKDEKLQNLKRNLTTRGESPGHFIHESDELGSAKEEKKRLRVPTFNELTGPYHEPFCLDIFISKASARACIVHRVTSKVVVVAHSISKDMKFDLTSTRNAKACHAVGEVLAQRALADDIHDVVYTPRRGDVLEGKLGIVLRAITENGVRVKLKLKQRKQKGGKRSSWSH